jgi:hypothetical protein
MNAFSVEQMNDCIKQFGTRQKAFMRSENRALLRSVLFDVPRRSSIGWYCYYDRAPGLLRELMQQLSPEEIGRRMRQVCSRPYYLQLSILMCSYFGARQQLLLNDGLRPGQRFTQEKADDALLVVDFWQRACRAYRADGQLFADQGDTGQPILPSNDVEWLNERITPSSADEHVRLRRLAATLELYGFMLHGEQRDGLFAHGPYDVGNDNQVVMLEFTDLQNDFLPWADTAVKNPYPNLVLVRRISGVQVHFDMFGGIRWDAPDLAPHVLAEGLFTRTVDDTVVPVSMDEIEHIESCAAAAQTELFLKAAEWSPRYKAEYGVQLFANHFRLFFESLSDSDAWDERIRSEFEDASHDLLDDLLAQDQVPSIWNYMATTDDDFFWPVVA